MASLANVRKIPASAVKASLLGLSLRSSIGSSLSRRCPRRAWRHLFHSTARLARTREPVSQTPNDRLPPCETSEHSAGDFAQASFAGRGAGVRNRELSAAKPPKVPIVAQKIRPGSGKKLRFHWNYSTYVRIVKIHSPIKRTPLKYKSDIIRKARHEPVEPQKNRRTGRPRTAFRKVIPRYKELTKLESRDSIIRTGKGARVELRTVEPRKSKEPTKREILVRKVLPTPVELRKSRGPRKGGFLIRKHLSGSRDLPTPTVPKEKDKDQAIIIRKHTVRDYDESVHLPSGLLLKKKLIGTFIRKIRAPAPVKDRSRVSPSKLVRRCRLQVAGLQTPFTLRGEIRLSNSPTVQIAYLPVQNLFFEKWKDVLSCRLGTLRGNHFIRTRLIL